MTQTDESTPRVLAPRVGIVMGSASDAPIMRAAAEELERLDVAHEMRVLSAHRTPEETIAYGREAAQRGILVLIAGAGGAAHLPGVLAAVASIPVIGVPIALRHLGGLDSLLSIAQMPQGVPVATVGVNGARNAGLFALRILALSDDQVAEGLAARREQQAEDVRAQDLRVRTERDPG